MKPLKNLYLHLLLTLQKEKWKNKSRNLICHSVISGCCWVLRVRGIKIIFVASLYFHLVTFFSIESLHCFKIYIYINLKRRNKYMCVYKLKCKSSITAFCGVLNKRHHPKSMPYLTKLIQKEQKPRDWTAAFITPLAQILNSNAYRRIYYVIKMPFQIHVLGCLVTSHHSPNKFQMWKIKNIKWKKLKIYKWIFKLSKNAKEKL